MTKRKRRYKETTMAFTYCKHGTVTRGRRKGQCRKQPSAASRSQSTLLKSYGKHLDNRIYAKRNGGLSGGPSEHYAEAKFQTKQVRRKTAIARAALAKGDCEGALQWLVGAATSLGSKLGHQPSSFGPAGRRKSKKGIAKNPGSRQAIHNLTKQITKKCLR